MNAVLHTVLSPVSFEWKYWAVVSLVDI